MRKAYCLAAIILFAVMMCSYLGNAQVTIDTTCNTARLSFETPLNNEAVSITVFKDTLIFEENFENFLSDQVISGTTIGAAGCLVEIPQSLTQFPGCKAQNIKVNEQGECYFFQGAFSTPQMNIPQSSKVLIQMRSTAANVLKINNEAINHAKTSQLLSRTISNACNEMILSNTTSSTLYIDYIKIISPREVLSAQNYAVVNGELLINNLLPNTGYYVEITDNQNQVSEKYFLKTKKRNEELESRIQTSESVILELGNRNDCSATSLSLYKVENPTKDLFFSRIASASSNFGLEIFNGTGADICLGDYEVVFYPQRQCNAGTIMRYRFSENDTIDCGKYVCILNNLTALSHYDYTTFPIKTDNGFLGGNDAFALLKKDAEGNYRDTVDLFGKLIETSDGTATYKDKILTRKNSIIEGIRTNNAENHEIDISEWNVVEFSTENLNSESVKHSLSSPVTYSLVSTIDLSNVGNSLVLNGLESQTKYLCVLKHGDDTVKTFSFSTGNIIQSIASGDWNNTSVWENGVVPQDFDKVIIRKGDRISITEGLSVRCNELVLQSDYSTALFDENKSELKINGSLTVGKAEVQAQFDAYTSNANGWNFFAVPIDVRSSSRDEIAASFQRGYEDDLYYLDESKYAWIPYLSEVEDTNFFSNSLGYLVAYQNDKTISFKGDLFLEESINLLSNASYNPSLGNGYHLVSNPYPFSVGLNNFSANNIGGMWLLNPSTGAYIPSDNNNPSSFLIPPFAGIMTKVNDAENSLVLRKNPLVQAKILEDNSKVSALKFRLLSSGGSDELRLYFKDNAIMGYDAYDTYKLFSVGSAPDIYCTIDSNDLSIAAMPILEDSLRLGINVFAKTNEDLQLRLYELEGEFDQIDLINIEDNSLVCSFVTDSICVIPYEQVEKPKNFELVLKKRMSNAENKKVEELKYVQSGKEIEIQYPMSFEQVLVSDVQGKEILKTNQKSFTLPSEGCFVIVVESKGKIYSAKIISL